MTITDNFTMFLIFLYYGDTINCVSTTIFQKLGMMERKNELYSSVSGPIHIFNLEEFNTNFL